MFDYKPFKLDKPELLQVYTNGLLPSGWKEHLFSGGWFKIFLPKSLSGFELPLSEGLDVLYHTAAVQGSLGWRVNLGAGAGYFAGSMPETLASQIFRNDKALISGSGATTGSAFRKGDFWLVNGTWNFCTGADIATAFTVNALLEDGTYRTFVLPPQQVIVHTHWPYSALKATATFTIEAKDVKIPESFAFTIGTLQPYTNYPLYRLDFLSFARFCMSASLLGLAHCFLQHVSEFLSSEPISPNDELNNLSHAIQHWRNDLYTLADQVYASLSSQSIVSAEDSVRGLTSKYKNLLEQLSFKIVQICGMSIFQSHCLPFHAAMDFWLAGKHFLCR